MKNFFSVHERDDVSHVVVNVRVCEYSRCLMCGFGALRDFTQEEIIEDFERILPKLTLKNVSFYISGSFFNDREFTKKTREFILKSLSEKEKVTVEAMPEHLSKEKLKGFENLEVAIGLESASDFVLKNCVRKSFRFKDYLKASDVLKDLNLPLKTYVLFKPPFLTEKNSIEDFRKTILEIKDLTDSISVNPVCVMRGTPLETLWRGKLYRPPWLWSLLEGLRFAKKEFLGELICEPMMASTMRGVHNCGRCDREILSNLRRGIYEDIECSCKLTWKKVLEIEERINGVMDERFFKRR